MLRTASRYDHNELPGDGLLDPGEAPMIEQEVLAAELRAAVRAAFTQLPDRCRQLLSMLISDPPVSYAQISATLAQLSYGSERDRDALVGVRSEAASIRALTFTSPNLTIELEVGDNALLGQLVPTGEGTIDVQTRAGDVATVSVDEVGCFPISPIPPSPFRLRCRTAGGSSVVTGWITL